MSLTSCSTHKRTPRSAGRRGNAFIEFALVFVIFIAMILAAFDFAFAIFARATLQHAVRSGVRFAILGQAPEGVGHDSAIKDVVSKNALGLLNTEEALDRVAIEYFLPDCSGSDCSSGNNSASNIVVVSVRNYPITPIGPLLRGAGAININVAAIDKMEPFPGTPPPRSLSEVE